MREILFRGKRKDYGKWIEGYYLHQNKRRFVNETHYIVSVDGFYHSIDPSTVCQFTGLYDKNGRKIFEGDLIEFADFFESEIHRGVACWGDLAFWFDCTETEGDEGIYSLAYISANILEVIGNIYDNPGLLEV